MSPVRMRRAAWSLAALALALEVAYYAISLATGMYEFQFFNLLRSAFVVVFATMGALVATRHPRNAIGWIFLGVALTSGLFDLGVALVEWALTGGAPSHLVEIAAACVNVGWAPGVLVSGTFLLLFFPDGRLPSRRWRIVGWCAAAGITGFIGGYGVTPGPIDNFTEVRNPVGIDSPLIGPLIGLAGLLLAIGVLGSVASVVVRFRSAAHVQRQQIKWLATAGAVLAVALVFRNVAEATELDADLANSVLLLGLLGLPISIGIAILRHRLYDIDVVINRTLVYAALTATLAGTYLGSVLLLQLLLSPITASNSLVIAVSTLAVAALFQPARRRIQATVDRRFFRRKYDAARTLEQFGAHLRDEVDLDTLGDDLRAVVAQTMQPAHITLWLRVPE